MSGKKVQNVDLGDLPDEQAAKSLLSNSQVDLVKGVRVQLRAMLGNTEISVGELFQLKENHVLKLDASTVAPVDLVLDDKVVARGTLVVVDENFGVQITEVIKV